MPEKGGQSVLILAFVPGNVIVQYFFAMISKIFKNLCAAFKVFLLYMTMYLSPLLSSAIMAFKHLKILHL